MKVGDWVVPNTRVDDEFIEENGTGPFKVILITHAFGVNYIALEGLDDRYLSRWFSVVKPQIFRCDNCDREVELYSQNQGCVCKLCLWDMRLLDPPPAIAKTPRLEDLLTKDDFYVSP